MEFIYTNKGSEHIIHQHNIVQQTQNGIVVNNNDCWRFVPDTMIQQETVQKGLSPYVSSENQQDHNQLLAYSDSVSQQYTENIEYRFGFKDLSVSTKKMAPVSGIISDFINVSGAEYITLTGEIYNTEYGSIEVSILDNTDEIPILLDDPKKIPEIFKEQLFYQQNLRFIPIGNSIILYEDDIVSDKDYASLTEKDFKEHRYTVSYRTSKDAFYFNTVSDKIRIKIVLRQYAEDNWIELHNLIIHKFGETLQWNSNL